jgi:tartrate-resistant acid phosphatase type 5
MVVITYQKYTLLFERKQKVVLTEYIIVRKYRDDEGIKTKKEYFKMSITYNHILRFIAFGDWGRDTKMRQSFFNVFEKKKYELDFVILLGDNFYPNGVTDVKDTQFENSLRQFPSFLRLYALLGNHDYHSDAYSQVLYSSLHHRWRMPFFYYDEILPVGDTSLHLICLDTCILAPLFTRELFIACHVSEKKQLEFLHHVSRLQFEHKKWIAETLAKSKSRWKIVCGHYPLLSNGPHHLSTELSTFLRPLFQKYDIDAYISAHDHNGQIFLEKNTYFFVSGAVMEHIYPTQNRGFQQVFQSHHSGVFQFEFTQQTMTVNYIEKDGNTVFTIFVAKP